ncbi:unnamed protein product [Heligmosomoides polygyrus]|uniref:SLC12 domain-containing protein n=1 Tax=Heligmosomoides polygyrus TaxID=6339 RepID=A0A3P8CEF1_HELPZ|nr:unnamed protein product [Heligmosomoides polygyrus]
MCRLEISQLTSTRLIPKFYENSPKGRCELAQETQSLDTGENFSISDYMRTMALPDVQPFGGVRYAKANNWDDVENDEEPLKPLVILPDSFSSMDAFFKVKPNVHRKMYRDLGEIGSILDRSESSCCILVGPRLDISIPKKEWCRLASFLAAAARNGTKILAVTPPRGDRASSARKRYGDMGEALELAKSVAVLAEQSLVSCIPATESGMGPSHGPSARPRNLAPRKKIIKKRSYTKIFQGKSNFEDEGKIDTILCPGTIATNRSPWQFNLRCILFRFKDNA